MLCEVNLVSNQNRCKVVIGALTIFGIIESTLREDVLAAIRNWMGRGNFSDVSDAIERITWREINPELRNNPSKQSLSSDESNDGKKKSLYAAFALLGLLPIFILMLYRKYRDSRDRQVSSLDSDDEFSPPLHDETIT